MPRGENDCAEVFRLFSNAQRLRIAMMLDGKEMTVTQIVEVLGASHNSVSQHLARFRQLGAVSLRRESRNTFYQLTSQGYDVLVQVVRDWMNDTVPSPELYSKPLTN